MSRTPFLLLLPLVLCLAMIPAAAQGVAPFALSVSAVLQGAIGWLLFFFVALGIVRGWRATRGIVVITYLYMVTLAIFDYFLCGEHLIRFVIKLVSYSLVAYIAFALSPRISKSDDSKRDA